MQNNSLQRLIYKQLPYLQTAGVFKCSESRCLCCQQLFLEISYTFENFGKQFFLKMKMTCDRRNLMYVINPTCKEEYIRETGIGDSKLQDRAGYTGNKFDNLDMKNDAQKCILELVAKETSQYFCFYNCFQMTQIFDGNMKITLQRSIKLY